MLAVRASAFEEASRERGLPDSGGGIRELTLPARPNTFSVAGGYSIVSPTSIISTGETRTLSDAFAVSVVAALRSARWQEGIEHGREQFGTVLPAQPPGRRPTSWPCGAARRAGPGCGGVVVGRRGLQPTALNRAQDARRQPPYAYVPPRGYVCYRAAGPITLDGKLDDAAWKAAPWTADFVDIEGDRRRKPRFRTRVKMLWDDKCLYIGAELEEPHVQGSYTRRDSYIFHEDNDFEVFLNPDGNNHNYAELEMNALNTVWDLHLKKPYRDGGKAEDKWDIPGLKTAVHVNGTLNNPRDLDKGWTIEIAIPWEIVRALNDKPARAPRDGDQWRFNFSRVEWSFDIVDGKYVRRKDRREDNWVWSPQGVVNMHQPETWGYVQFSTAAPGKAAFRPDPAGPARHLLHRIYHAQKTFKKVHGRYARSLAELKLADLHDATLAGPPLLEAEADRFRATVVVKLPGGGRQRWHLREDSRVWNAR